LGNGDKGRFQGLGGLVLDEKAENAENTQDERPVSDRDKEQFVLLPQYRLPRFMVLNASLGESLAVTPTEQPDKLAATSNPAIIGHACFW
jgi:hypothetical protein